MSDFITFARAHGLEIDPGRLYPGEKIRRCGTVDKPKSTNGAYFWDGERGWVFNWASEARVQWFNDRNAQPWTEAEKTAWRRRREAIARADETRHEQAARRAGEMVKAAKPGPHDYLIRKGLPEAQGLVTADNLLVIPMRTLAGSLVGAQVIGWQEADRVWVKKFIPGTRAKGAVYRIGNPRAAETILVEGYATGLSVAAALRVSGGLASVLVTFSANNLQHVAAQVRGRALVFADNDASGTGQRVAEATGLPCCMSPVQGEDANDLHLRAGLMAVCQLLMEVRRR